MERSSTASQPIAEEDPRTVDKARGAKTQDGKEQVEKGTAEEGNFKTVIMSVRKRKKSMCIM